MMRRSKLGMVLVAYFFFIAPFAVVLAQRSDVSGQNPLQFGQMSRDPLPAKFLPEVLTRQRYPHGQLAFSLDGREVYWSAMLRDGPEQTIYYSVYDGKNYSPPQRAPFAADSGNGGPAFSYDGNRLFFNAQLAALNPSSRRPTAICYVERKGPGWSKPVIVESTYDTLMTKGQVSVARNGNIYFSGRKYNERTPGIYVCRYMSGKYMPPEKLGGPIAHVPLLVDPWIDPNEEFLLVSCPPTEGPPTLTDIGICRPMPDGGWSLPASVGGGVNTSAFERFPSLSRDGKYLFFIRSFSRQFVGDQAHFYWVPTRNIKELKPIR